MLITSMDNHGVAGVSQIAGVLVVLVSFTSIGDYFMISEIIYRLWTHDNTRNNSIVRLLQNENCIDLMLGLKCGYHFRPRLWPWPWIVKYEICYVLEKWALGLQCGHHYLGHASMTLTFRSLLSSTSHVSGIVGLIATKHKNKFHPSFLPVFRQPIQICLQRTVDSWHINS